MKRSFARVTAIVACLTLGACGGGGGSSTTSATTPLTGYIIDAPVQGLSYTCGTLTGTTGADGSFQHDAGATCTFKIGNVTLGSISTFPSDGVISPYELAGVSRTDALNPNALAIAQFLQSLDDGSKPGQLTIPASATAALSNVIPTSIVSGSTALDQNQLTTLVATASNNAKTLVSAAAAASALTSYLQTTSLIATKLVATALQGTAPLSTCPSGGITVTAGIDINGNGVLDSSEVTSTQYVCNGANGTNGAAGTNGTNGLSALVSIVSELAGANCASGGKKINSGMDTNGNGVLDTAEITYSNYVCNGATGPAGPGVTWVNVSGTTQQAVSNTGYLANNAAQVTVTLPASLAVAVGDVVQVSGIGAGGWKIAQNAGQSIITNDLPGTGGLWFAQGSTGSWTSIASSSDGTKLVAGLYGGQIYTSTDSGVTWAPRDAGRTWYSVASSSDGIRLVAGTATEMTEVLDGLGQLYTLEVPGQLYTSANSGLTWTARATTPNRWQSVASSADGIKLVAVEYPGFIYTSTNSGVTWVQRDLSRNWYSVASSSDGAKLVAVEQSGFIYTSSDFGVTWAPQGTSSNWSSVASSSNGIKLVAALNGGNIYTSTDSGLNWTPRDSARAWASLASSSDGTKLVAGVNGGLIYTSNDSGASWTPRDSSRQWLSVTSSSDGAKLAAVTSGEKIYTSSPGTTRGTAGSITGVQYDAIELQYVGNDTFMLLSHEGYITVQ